QAFPVALLQADYGPVELPLRPPERALDTDAPGQLVERGQRQEATEPGLATLAARERAAGPDPWRIGGEGTEQAVDVVDDAGFGRARVLVGGDQPRAGGPDRGVLLARREERHL